MGLAFAAHFLHDFSQDIKQNVLLSSYVVNWWRHQLEDLSSIILQSNGREAEKEGRTEIQKFEYLQDGKSFLGEIKGIFQFLKGYHLVKN